MAVTTVKLISDEHASSRDIDTLVLLIANKRTIRTSMVKEVFKGSSVAYIQNFSLPWRPNNRRACLLCTLYVRHFERSKTTGFPFQTFNSEENVNSLDQ